MTAFNIADVLDRPLREAREAFERAYLEAQIHRHGGNLAQTAITIQMERSCLSRRVRLMGLRPVVMAARAEVGARAKAAEEAERRAAEEAKAREEVERKVRWHAAWAAKKAERAARQALPAGPKLSAADEAHGLALQMERRA